MIPTTLLHLLHTSGAQHDDDEPVEVDELALLEEVVLVHPRHEEKLVSRKMGVIELSAIQSTAMLAQVSSDSLSKLLILPKIHCRTCP